MPIIYTYPSATPTASDLLIFSDVSATDPAKDTRKCTIQNIVDLITPLVPGGGTVTSVKLDLNPAVGTDTGLRLWSGVAFTEPSLTITSTGSFEVGGTLVVGHGGTGAITHTNGYFLKGAGGSPITSQQYINLDTEVTDELKAINGGTGFLDYAVGDIIYANSTTTFVKLTVGSNDDILTLNTGVPTWGAASAVAVTSVEVSGGSTGLTFSGGPVGPGTGTITMAGMLGVVNGGTGAATFTAGSVLLGNGTSAITPTTSMINGQLLIGDTGNPPSLATLTEGTGITITNSGGGIEIASDTYNLNAGVKVGTSVPINLDALTEADSLVNLTEGSGITLTRNSATEITIAASASGSDGIYSGSGSLTGGTTVTMATNDLQFTGTTSRFSVETGATSIVNSTTVIEVFQASDLPATLAANTTYVIRGTISTNSPIAVTNSGCSIVGIDRNRDKLVWTGLTGTTMLTITDVDFDLEGLWLSSTITGSVLIEADNHDVTEDAYNYGRNKILTITNCQFRNCFDIAFIEGFDLVDINNSLFFYVQAPNFGVKFLNTSKIEITSCELIRWFDEESLPTPASYANGSMIEILPNAGGPGIGAINISGCIIHPQQTQNGIEINTGSTTGFGTIAANTFVNVGLTSGEVFLGDALTPANGAYSETECLKYDIFSNQGLPNSIAYGSFYDTTGGVDTLTGGTTSWIPVQYGAIPVASGSQRISFSNPATNRGLLTYNGTKSILAQVSVSITYNDITGGTDTYNFGLSKNGLAAPQTASIISSQASGGAYFGVTLLFIDSMVTGDDYELVAQNQAGGVGDDIEVTSVQFLIKE